ncbi:hypothetical protein GCM10027053_01890 [Intrasporangium mesophilum]
MSDRTRPRVALTFDDGPGRHTARLLDVLAAREVRVTFFLVGREVAARPDLARAQVAAGHVIGNHSFTHPDLTALGPGELADEIDRTSDAIAAATGSRPTLARPPFGATNPTVAGLLADRGLAQVLWDLDTEDWKGQDARTTTRTALEGARDGAVVLMHDTQETTVDAVPGIIDGLRERGFAFVTVPDLADR